MSIIVLEGIDKSGKSTQAKRVADALKCSSFALPSVFSGLTDTIRGLLSGNTRMVKLLEDGTYAKSIQDTEAALKALFTMDLYIAAAKFSDFSDKGLDVVVDRYWQSNVCYGAADGWSKELLMEACSFAPDANYNFLIDTSLEDVYSRLPIKGDKYESDKVKLARIKLDYISLWRDEMDKNPDSFWAIIDGSGTEEEVTNRILSHINK